MKAQAKTSIKKVKDAATPKSKYEPKNKPKKFTLEASSLMINVSVYYGLEDSNLEDVTTIIIDQCISHNNSNGLWNLPLDDSLRTKFFGDPVPNSLKKIFIRGADRHTSEIVVLAGETAAFQYDGTKLSCQGVSRTYINHPDGALIYFGLKDQNLVDVTSHLIDRCLHDSSSGGWVMPKDDNARTSIFGDPVPNQVKKVYVRFHAVNDKLATESIISSGETCEFKYLDGVLSLRAKNYAMEAQPSLDIDEKKNS